LAFWSCSGPNGAGKVDEPIAAADRGKASPTPASCGCSLGHRGLPRQSKGRRGEAALKRASSAVDKTSTPSTSHVEDKHLAVILIVRRGSYRCPRRSRRAAAGRQRAARGPSARLAGTVSAATSGRENFSAGRWAGGRLRLARGLVPRGRRLSLLERADGFGPDQPAESAPDLGP